MNSGLWCIRCGCQIAEGARFCRFCGHALEVLTDIAASERTTRRLLPASAVHASWRAASRFKMTHFVVNQECAPAKQTQPLERRRVLTPRSHLLTLSLTANVVLLLIAVVALKVLPTSEPLLTEPRAVTLAAAQDFPASPAPLMYADEEIGATIKPEINLCSVEKHSGLPAHQSSAPRRIRLAPKPEMKVFPQRVSPEASPEIPVRFEATEPHVARAHDDVPMPVSNAPLSADEARPHIRLARAQVSQSLVTANAQRAAATKIAENEIKAAHTKECLRALRSAEWALKGVEAIKFVRKEQLKKLRSVAISET